MCSIIGSFEPKMLVHLYELNSYRGTHSHSITVYDYRNKKISYIDRQLGELDEKQLNTVTSSFSGCYYIVHSQAPTTENTDDTSIHPARMHHKEVRDTSLLWHNGILKPKTINMLRENTGLGTTWDTQLLLQHMINNESLSDIDGSFACLMYHTGELYMFRNEISPLFIDFDMNISSTIFEIPAGEAFGSAFSISPNRVFKLDLYNKATIIQSTFTTKNSPYLLEL